MPIRDSSQREIPKVEARHRWAFTIFAGLDIESTLGLPNQAADLAAIGAAAGLGQTGGQSSTGLGSLAEVGTVESLDLTQRRDATQRFGFNADPLQPFQTVPHGGAFGLSLSRVMLKKMPEVEASFQFLPSNLLLQQLPFVLELRDVGDGTPSTFIRHLIFGCWFVDSKTRYDVLGKDDTKLIQSATILPGRVLTFDASFGGSPVVQGASVLGGLALQAAQSNNDVRNLLEDFELG